ncbi:MAG TPA: lipoprotein, partial [Gammaproteobacteria bacterium]|nr:lipoprotein [Gammaproteobacteria bacterium]
PERALFVERSMKTRLVCAFLLLAVSLSAISALTGCGNKGPLYLPGPPPQTDEDVEKASKKKK